MCMHLLLMTKYRDEHVWVAKVGWKTISLEMRSSGNCVGGGLK